MRQTSIQVYRQIMAEGLLSPMRKRVYDAVYHHGPCTSAEAYIHMAKTEKSPISQSRARFTELRDMGVLRECGTKKCGITGRKAILWDVTTNLPKDLPEKPKKKESGGVQAILDYMMDNQKMMITFEEVKRFL